MRIARALLPQGVDSLVGNKKEEKTWVGQNDSVISSSLMRGYQQTTLQEAVLLSAQSSTA